MAGTTNPAPIARLTVVTLGVNDIRASIAFHEALGFARKFRATGERSHSSIPAVLCLGLFS